MRIGANPTKNYSQNCEICGAPYARPAWDNKYAESLFACEDCIYGDRDLEPNDGGLTGEL